MVLMAVVHEAFQTQAGSPALALALILEPFFPGDALNTLSGGWALLDTSHTHTHSETIESFSALRGPLLLSLKWSVPSAWQGVRVDARHVNHT